MKSLRRSGLVASSAVFQQLEVTAAGNEWKASEVPELDMESVDEDDISAEAESHLSAACANMMTDVIIQHAIVSFDLNICELVQK